MTSLELLICAALVAISAFMSSSEVAIFSLSRFQLRYLKEHFRQAHRRIKRLLADPGGLLISILVINEIVNIALSSLVTGSIARYRHASGALRLPGVPDWALDTVFGILFTAPVVLLFCEITPKVIGARANQLIATLTSSAVSLVYDFAFPLRMLLRRAVLIVSRVAGDGPTEGAHSGVLKESDFLLMLEEGHREGAVHESELGLIRNVFELDDTTVSDILTPIHQVQSMPVSSTVRAALTLMRGNRYSRVPIVSANRKQVVGILHANDLLRAKLDPSMLSQTVDEFMRNPIFVGPQTRLNALFRKFKQQRHHLAVVTAGTGAHAPSEVLGIVTMDDVLEALFGDLVPEEGITKDQAEKSPTAVPAKGSRA